ELAAVIDRRVNDARSLPPNEYEKHLKGEVLRLQDPDDEKARQKKSVRWRAWLGPGPGEPHRALDGGRLSAVKIEQRMQGEVGRLFAEGLPDDCPDDPLEKQQYLAGLAAVSLLLGDGGKVGTPELIAVVDATEVGPDGAPTVDWGLPVDL